jgi:hypothetical protein
MLWSEISLNLTSNVWSSVKKIEYRLEGYGFGFG